MKRYARIENNVILEIVNIDGDIKDYYHPAIVEEFQEFTENAEVGYSLVDGVWTAPKVLTQEEIQALIDQEKQDQEQLNKE